MDVQIRTSTMASDLWRAITSRDLEGAKRILRTPVCGVIWITQTHDAGLEMRVMLDVLPLSMLDTHEAMEEGIFLASTTCASEPVGAAWIIRLEHELRLLAFSHGWLSQLSVDLATGEPHHPQSIHMADGDIHGMAKTAIVILDALTHAGAEHAKLCGRTHGESEDHE